MFLNEDDPLVILRLVNDKIVRHCRQQDAAQMLPRLNTECAYKVVMKALQRLSQLLPHVAAQCGLTIDGGGTVHAESDHESTVILALDEMCGTEQVQPIAIGRHSIEGRAACAYKILQKMVNISIGRADETGAPEFFPGATIDVIGEGGDIKVVVSVSCIVLILLLIALAYTTYPNALNQRMFWLIIFILVVGVCLANSNAGESSSQADLSVQQHQSVASNPMREAYYMEHSYPPRTKAMAHMIFGLTPAQRFGDDKSSDPRHEQYFREKADIVRSKAMRTAFFGNQYEGPLYAQPRK